MAQTIWKGRLAFGLVSIPVRLHRAVEEKTVRFREIEGGTGRRVRHRRVVEAIDESGTGSSPPAPQEDDVGPSAAEEELPSGNPTERTVEYEEIVKGFELPSGEMVALRREELEALRPEQTRTIEILEFVDLAEIDPVFFDRSYYVVPQQEPGAERAYTLLLRAMEDAGRVAIGSFVLRTREHLAAVRPLQGALGLVTLHYGDEIRSPADVGYVPSESEPPKREVRLAEQLIAALVTSWDPSRHRDSYRTRVLELIEERAASGAVLEAPPERAEVAEPIDLMAALKASVEAVADRKKVQRPKRRTG